MTDEMPALSFDMDAFNAEYTAYEKLAAELHSVNKLSLFAALAAAGITCVIVTFDGYGDSGQMESFEAKAGEDEVEIPGTVVDIARALYGSNQPERITQSLRDAIETLAYAYLEETHGGWENNDGAYGEFVFDVSSGTIQLDYNERYTTSENHIHEF
jgi:hypothetical protein